MKTVTLKETCVFLSLSLSRMGDKRGVSSDDIEVDADKDKVKVRKVIFKSASFDAIKSLDSEIRRYVRSQCFPFESGMHLVPLAMVDLIQAHLESYNIRRCELIDKFSEIYPTLVVEAQPKLRALFKESDYNSDNIVDQFSMGWQFMMLETPGNIGASLFKREQAKMKARMDEAFEEARLLLRETCLNLVTHLRFSLESDAHGAPKRLSTSTVTNLQAFLNTFDLRNVTNDVELQRYITDAKKLTSGIDAESLRTMDGLRLRLRGELSLIEESITNSLVVQPTRRIKVK